jgi:DNA helicase-2/ATP-dependent DNA helicase PcrA
MSFVVGILGEIFLCYSASTMDLLKNLNDKQREAVLATDGAVLVLAGAGSGKTKALTHRIAYLVREKGVSPWNILAVTFTNKAAKEMKERITKLIAEAGVGESGGASFGNPFAEYDVPTIGTFHSICVRILRKHAHLMDFENSFVIYDTADQEIIMKKLMEERNMDPKKMNPRAMLGAISGAKNQLIGPEEYHRYANSHFTEKVSDLYTPYQKALRTNGAMDFDDLLMKTVELFRKYPEVLGEYQERFKYICVDEYQDTNHAQYIFTKLLAAKYGNLCVIGDEDQSIYSWRGATIKNILDFEKDYPGAVTVKLEQNYRSTQPILDAAHSVISLNSQRKEKKLWTEKVEGDRVKIWMARSERHEGEMVAGEILRVMRQYESPSYRHFVVLYRTNAQSRVMEEIFLRSGIPYKIVGGTKFYDRKEIKDLLAYLRVIQNPRDSVSLTRIINVPARNLGPKTLEAVQQFASQRNFSLFAGMEEVASLGDSLADSKIQGIQKFVALIRELQEVNREHPASGVIKYVLDRAGYKNFLDDGTSEGEERLENVRELISVATKYDGLEAGMSLKIFLEEVSLISDADQVSEDSNCVTMMTIHAAKGLEFPHVFVVGLEDGIFPSSRSMLERDQLEEERRLMYVAVTRAKECLYLLHAQERLLYGEYKSNAPSQFLKHLPEHVVERNYTPRERSSGGYSNSGSGGYSSEVGERMSRERLSKGIFGTGGFRDKRFEKVENTPSKPVPLENVESSYRDGDRVTHPVFGSGIVMNVTGGIITIVFENPSVGVKKLAVSIAPLTKVG